MGEKEITVNSVPIEDTFAEAFPMTAARLIVTAETPAWARTAGQAATGYAASVIGCDAEAGIETHAWPPRKRRTAGPASACCCSPSAATPCKRPSINRVGQCVLTCPTTACYNGLPVVKDKTIRVGGNLRFFGDGFQFSKKLEGRRFWRLPVMDGEFTCEDVFGTIKGVAGGNFLIVGASQADGLAAAEAAVAAIRAGSRRHPALSRRHRPQRQQGRQPLQEAAGQHQRRLLPDAARPGRNRRCRRGPTPSTRSSSTASTWRRSRRRRASACGPRAGPASWASRRATTAASSGRFTCICTKSLGSCQLPVASCRLSVVGCQLSV